MIMLPTIDKLNLSIGWCVYWFCLVLLWNLIVDFSVRYLCLFRVVWNVFVYLKEQETFLFICVEHHAKFVEHHAEFVEHHTEFVEHHAEFTEQHAEFVEHHAVFVEHHSEFSEHHAEFGEHHVSFVLLGQCSNICMWNTILINSSQN